MKQMTSAMAAKELKRLNDQHDTIIIKEKKARTFTAAIQENVEDARPEYDFDETQKELKRIEDSIRKIKHSINKFNLTQKIPDFDMTIDQMLVYIPQLTARKKKLDNMRNMLPKERSQGGALSRSSVIIEYDYANYDVEKAEEEYEIVNAELAKAQNALDKVNSTVMFEVEI